VSLAAAGKSRSVATPASEAEANDDIGKAADAAIVVLE
jgi:hypothetical protein